MVKIGINGFGRIGRLVFRAAWARDDIEICQVNDPGGDAQNAAYLLNFDSVQGTWGKRAEADGDALVIDGRRVQWTRGKDCAGAGWGKHIDVLLECSGKFKTLELLQPYLDAAARPQRGIVLDLSRLAYVSSAGLRCFVLAAKQAKAQGGRIVIAGMQPVVAEIFQISRFNLVFEIFSSVRDALAALSADATAAFDRG